MTQQVPEDFRRLGFSGAFRVEVSIEPGFYREPPCLIAPGWLLLSRRGFRGELVRRDENALVDLVMGRPRG